MSTLRSVFGCFQSSVTRRTPPQSYPLAFVAHCAGNWQVNGGTDDYNTANDSSTVKGTGTFIETQWLDENSAGTGFITLTGRMHIDP